MDFPTDRLDYMINMVHRSALLYLCEPTQVHEPLKQIYSAENVARFTIRLSHPKCARPHLFTFQLTRNTKHSCNPTTWLLAQIWNMPYTNSS